MRRYRRAIAIWAENRNLNKFLTLTLDPQKLNGEDSTRYANRTFAKLRSILHRKYGKSLSYIRIVEYQKNGNAHFHVLLNQYIDIEWMREQWQSLGGGWNVWISRASIRCVAAYITKYLTKQMSLHAPARSRRVTCSRDIRLFEKKLKDAVYELVKAPIECLRKQFLTVYSEIFLEQNLGKNLEKNEVLVSFVIRNSHVS
jgi:hypothetical protein